MMQKSHGRASTPTMSRRMREAESYVKMIMKMVQDVNSNINTSSEVDAVDKDDVNEYECQTLSESDAIDKYVCPTLQESAGEIARHLVTLAAIILDPYHPLENATLEPRVAKALEALTAKRGRPEQWTGDEELTAVLHVRQAITEAAEGRIPRSEKAIIRWVAQLPYWKQKAVATSFDEKLREAFERNMERLGARETIMQFLDRVYPQKDKSPD